MQHQQSQLFFLTHSYLPIILKNRVACINKAASVLERSPEIGSSDNTIEILKTIFQYTCILAVSRTPICKTINTMFCSTRFKWILANFVSKKLSEQIRNSVSCKQFSCPDQTSHCFSDVEHLGYLLWDLQCTIFNFGYLLLLSTKINNSLSTVAMLKWPKSLLKSLTYMRF